MAMTNGSETVWDFSFFLHLSNHGFSARVSDWTLAPLAPGDFFFLSSSFVVFKCSASSSGLRCQAKTKKETRTHRCAPRDWEDLEERFVVVPMEKRVSCMSLGSRCEEEKRLAHVYIVCFFLCWRGMFEKKQACLYGQMIPGLGGENCVGDSMSSGQACHEQKQSLEC